MAVLKTIRGRSLKLTANKGDKTSSKSYAQIGVSVADDNIMATANAIGDLMAYPVEAVDLVTTERLEESA